jgi:hypothetical protein
MVPLACVEPILVGPPRTFGAMRRLRSPVAPCHPIPVDVEPMEPLAPDSNLVSTSSLVRVPSSAMAAVRFGGGGNVIGAGGSGAVLADCGAGADVGSIVAST